MELPPILFVWMWSITRKSYPLKEATRKPEKDLLQIILESAERSDLGQTTNRFVVDNCKNIYFAGYETTAVSAAWTLMLLALYSEWQDKVRAEILETYGGELLDADILHKMKTVSLQWVNSINGW